VGLRQNQSAQHLVPPYKNSGYRIGFPAYPPISAFTAPVSYPLSSIAGTSSDNILLFSLPRLQLLDAPKHLRLRPLRGLSIPGSSSHSW
jgi:hypothetical protein